MSADLSVGPQCADLGGVALGRRDASRERAALAVSLAPSEVRGAAKTLTPSSAADVTKLLPLLVRLSQKS